MMTEPVIVRPEEDPLTVLRTMAKFVSERRGIAEIWSPAHRKGGGLGAGSRIGYVVLCRQPEEKPVPIYCAATRTIQHMMLADWLHARGYEASSCVWQRLDQFSASPYAHGIPADLAWKLVIREAKVPPLPQPNLSEVEVGAAAALAAAGAGNLGAGLAAHVPLPPQPQGALWKGASLNNPAIKRLLRSKV